MHCSAQEMQRDMPTAELSDEDFADGSVDILTLLHKSGLVASSQKHAVPYSRVELPLTEKRFLIFQQHLQKQTLKEKEKL